MKLELIDEKVAADHSLQEQQQTFIEPENCVSVMLVRFSYCGRQ